jgi:hypothetical protein
MKNCAYSGSSKEVLITLTVHLLAVFLISKLIGASVSGKRLLYF